MSKPLAPSIADLLQRHSFADRLDDEIYLVRNMLLKKNAAYGNSALDPVRIFSSAPPAEQIAVRLDDKLSRLKRGHAAGEDVEDDLIGYLFLRRIARRLEADALEEAPRSVSDKKEPAPGTDAAASTSSPAPSVETNVSPRPAASACETELGWSPLEISIMFECYTCLKPGANILPRIWSSPAAADARCRLQREGLIDGTLRATPTGYAWIGRLLRTPAPQ